jgi:hypothetical protein
MDFPFYDKKSSQKEGVIFSSDTAFDDDEDNWTIYDNYACFDDPDQWEEW